MVQVVEQPVQQVVQQVVTQPVVQQQAVRVQAAPQQMMMQAVSQQMVQQSPQPVMRSMVRSSPPQVMAAPTTMVASPQRLQTVNTGMMGGITTGGFVSTGRPMVQGSLVQGGVTMSPQTAFSPGIDTTLG